MPTEIPDYTPPELTAEEAHIWGRLSETARKALMELDSSISPVVMASRLWERTLVAADRQRLGGDVEIAWWRKGTLRMWMEVRGLTNRFVAVAEIGSHLNLLTPDDYQWLLRETSLAVSGPSEAALRPQWDPATGRLIYDGQLIRRVRIFKRPSHIQRILDRIGLMRDNWPNLEAHGIFVSGEAAFMLPPGKTLVIASCGPQYGIETREIEIVAGATAGIEIQLQRRMDLKKLGWVCGDAHLHMIIAPLLDESKFFSTRVTIRNRPTEAYDPFGESQAALDAWSVDLLMASRNAARDQLCRDRPDMSRQWA